MNSAGILAIAATSPAFPPQLADLELVPDPIFAIGTLQAFEGPLVSIVGTRDPTAYGMRATRLIASALVQSGVGIVSGMARGIDAAAHRSALELAGRTIAVLGTGVDVPYPAGHRELHRVIAKRGLVLSENGSGARAHKGSFPRRNRIIAALAPLTIVVEAGLKSGALNTARHALELGRTLAAVPGPIDSPQSAGANLLLRDGATLISCVSDALALAGVSASVQPQPVNLSDTDARVWSAIGSETLSIDAIAARAHVATRECMAAVTSLELGGMVESLITGEIRRRI